MHLIVAFPKGMLDTVSNAKIKSAGDPQGPSDATQNYTPTKIKMPMLGSEAVENQHESQDCKTR